MNKTNILKKIEFKERSGIDCTKEYSQIIETVAEYYAGFSKEEIVSPLPNISPIPIVACRQIFPVCDEKFKTFVSSFEKYKSEPAKQSLKLAMCTAFESYEKFACFLSAKMNEYGNGTNGYKFDDIPDSPFLSVTEQDRSFDNNMDKSISLLKKIHQYTLEAITEADRSKFVSLSILLMGVTYDIFDLIRKERKNICPT